MALADRTHTPEEADAADPVTVRIEHVSKYFESTGTLAVDDVSLVAMRGEVLSICGENGAGKSTLMNLLFGTLIPDSGSITVGGHEVHSPATAIAAGLGMVHQHFKLVPSFTVAQNVMLGYEPTQRGLIDDQAAERTTHELAAQYGLPIPPRAIVGALPVGLQQRVEILKALRTRAQVLILDEPTAVLTPAEATELMVVARNLAASGHTVLLITHKLDEVMHASDRVVVMRRGRVVETRRTSETSIAQIAEAMVGREVRPAAPTAVDTGAVLLAVDDVSVDVTGGIPLLDAISFTVRGGQILGIAGITGNGQTELVEVLTGLRKATTGTVVAADHDVTGTSARAHRRWIGHIPEDRLAVGLDLNANVADNVTAPTIRRYRGRGPLLDRRRMLRRAREVIDRFSVASARPDGGVIFLSGGNMQKVILGRELGAEPVVLIANQPTRGLDVGSIEYVHRSLLDARARGAATVLVSAELDEVLALSDLVAVMSKGRLLGPFLRAEVDAERIGRLMAGGEA